jgi:hypothetical protein
METHLWTIKDGSIYHWNCLQEIEKKKEEEWMNIEIPPPVESRRIDGAEREPHKSFWKTLFSRKG